MSKYDALLQNPGSLKLLLSVAEPEDLSILADYITDKGEGRLSLDADICKKLAACSKHLIFTKADRDLIGTEILLFGGNSLANLYRGVVKKALVGALLGSAQPEVSPAIDYSELVKDVGKKAKATFGDDAPILDIEQSILLRIFKQAFDKMTEDERRKTLDDLGVDSIDTFRTGTFAAVGAAAGVAVSMASMNIASLVASAVSTQVLGRVAISSASFVGARGLAALAGPVGLAVTALWTLADLSSPAYRVTLPCVVQVAYMRQKYLLEITTNKCPKCANTNSKDAKFCSECGTALASAEVPDLL